MGETSQHNPTKVHSSADIAQVIGEVRVHNFEANLSSGSLSVRDSIRSESDTNGSCNRPQIMGWSELIMRVRRFWISESRTNRGQNPAATRPPHILRQVRPPAKAPQGRCSEPHILTSPDGPESNQDYTMTATMQAHSCRYFTIASGHSQVSLSSSESPRYAEMSGTSLALRSISSRGETH